MESLVNQLNQMCNGQPFETGWYLKDLRTGETANRRGHIVVPSASTRKIAILVTALRAVNQGKLSLDQPVKIEAQYQNNNSGCFQHFQPGFTIPLRDVLIMMIIVSDNACTGTVSDMVGLDQINDFCQSIGMVGTTHRYGIPPLDMALNHPLDAANTTTPADVGQLLGLLVQGIKDPSAAVKLGCTQALCQLALDILSWQKLNDKLPFLLPQGTKVAHKTGTGVRNHNDAGIVFTGDQTRFILTVYTEHVPPELPDSTPGAFAAKHLIAKLCRAVYDALNTPVPA